MVITQSGILSLTRGPIHNANGSLRIVFGITYINSMQIPIVVPHSARPTMDHESIQLAEPTPIRTGMVSLLAATK